MAINSYNTADDISNYSIGNGSNATSILSSNLSGIFGIPYQFMDTVDRRIPGTDIGVKYADKIVSRMPLLFLTPCRQVFMPGYGKEDKGNVLSELISGNGGDSSLLNQLNLKGGKYYTTKFAYDEYADQVNTMCKQEAKFLGIGNESIPIYQKSNGGFKKIKNINWNQVKNSAFDDYFYANKAAVFYLDGLTSMTDSFSNSSGESSLASSINGFSSTANEIKFLLGEDSMLANLVNSASEVTDSITNGLSGIVSNLTGGMLSDLASSGVSTVLSGGKIIFPKIWSDSSFSRSYSFDIKLRSPDHDTISIFLNIIVPFLHLLALVLPMGLKDNANAYNSPFLVKAYSKGMFNIDMGLITDMSVTRGAECQWNDDGLPTQMDISITIEDLYSSLYLTNKDNFADNLAVVTNTAMMDYLSNLAGLNIADVDLGRQIKMLGYLSWNTLLDSPSTIWNRFDNSIQNAIATLYKKL